jgi:hypothetical protein
MIDTTAAVTARTANITFIDGDAIVARFLMDGNIISHNGRTLVVRGNHHSKSDTKVYVAVTNLFGGIECVDFDLDEWVRLGTDLN